MTERAFIIRLEDEGCWVVPEWRWRGERGEPIQVCLRSGIRQVAVYVSSAEVQHADEDTVGAVLSRLRYELATMVVN